MVSAKSNVLFTYTYDVNPSPFSGIVASVAAFEQDGQYGQKNGKDTAKDNSSDWSTDMLMLPHFETPEARKELSVCEDG
jgi:hypothetical protein